MALCTFERWLAFFQKCGCAFFEIIGIEAVGKLLYFQFKAVSLFVVVGIHTVEHLLHNERTLAGNFLHYFLTFNHKLIGSGYIIYQSKLQCSACINHIGCKQKLCSSGAAYISHQSLGTTISGYHTQFNLRLPELRVRRGNAHVPDDMASSHPPPKANPFTAAITGLVHCSILLNMR